MRDVTYHAEGTAGRVRIVLVHRGGDTSADDPADWRLYFQLQKYLDGIGVANPYPYRSSPAGSQGPFDPE
jgi:hypothetical protein